MAPFIESAKRQARNIMNTLKQENPNSSFLFGAVFYRDHGDYQPTHTIPFCEDITDHIQFIQPDGGNDIPEDVASGYQAVLDMNWDIADVKFCFHIADAPPHGILWHQPDMYDRFLHPVGRPLDDLIDDMYRKDIHLSFIRINNTTDIMIANFKRIYGDKLNVMELDLHADEIEINFENLCIYRTQIYENKGLEVVKDLADILANPQKANY
jgi:hypothetical protein